MSGETERAPSGWTVDTLAHHFQRQLDDMRLLLDERYATQTKALDAAFAAADKAVQTALLSAEKAVTKAEMAADKRFEGVNEFRAALSDQTATFIPRAEAEAVTDRHAEDIADLRNLLATSAGHDAGSQLTKSQFYGGLALVVMVLGLLVAFANFAAR